MIAIGMLQNWAIHDVCLAASVFHEVEYAQDQKARIVRSKNDVKKAWKDFRKKEYQNMESLEAHPKVSCIFTFKQHSIKRTASLLTDISS